MSSSEEERKRREGGGVGEAIANIFGLLIDILTGVLGE